MSKQRTTKHLKQIVDSLVDNFIIEEADLFKIGTSGVHEQAISHRLAVMLEGVFPNYHIDCEYNKHSDAVKKCQKIKTVCCKCTQCNKENKGGNDIIIKPDIIIHKRNTNKDNLICFEIKKSEDCNYDIEKLKCLTTEYGYNLGVFINFKNDILKADIKYYSEGKKI